ncbi:DUF1501 domain-containing protein [Nocardioides marmorisolisilvae]|uniref:DUF1501 domain-containing protein n=1 Tax=Nocardioides marmorisolisilvae TaxID=1542737 RepID=A0A3N0DQ22_9ACTN|nr:DUF1501 domain-containing protein [Nocardioides marmorisolisilvae]RNL77536.1 DUF1501 domain-containing protein [Nocardioides marmorisolisilvae]
MNDCCEEFGQVSRRGLLRGAAGVLGVGAATSVFGATFMQTSYAATQSADNVLVLLSLRGAADGLSLVVPHADPAYYAARPHIAIPSDKLLAKDGFFGLHPSMKAMLPLWNAGKVAAVHATGLPVANRSHFSAMEELEDADPGSTARVGWLNRLIGQDTYTHPLEGIGLGMSVPITALYGPEPTVTTTSVDDLEVSGADDGTGRRTTSMHTMWSSAPGVLGKGARSALTAVADFTPVRKTAEAPWNGAVYSDDDLGRALHAAARTIKGDVGAQVIAVDHEDGWDMHVGLGTLEWGRMIDNAAALATSISGFFTDLGSQASKVTLVTISEFGRRVKENANYGLDHGHGNVMFIVGAGVKGGYYGTWPGLQNSLDADLAVTTDYRSVLSEIVVKRLGASSAAVFPGFAPETVGAVLSA